MEAFLNKNKTELHVCSFVLFLHSLSKKTANTAFSYQRLKNQQFSGRHYI